MDGKDLARLLLAKAAQDQLVVEKLLLDGDVADEVIGFHAQQAAEKLLKAILAARGVRVRRTHDLAELLDLCTDAGAALPDWLEACRELTPFAVQFRYELPVPGSASLDRSAALSLLRRLRAWCQAQLTTEAT